MNQNIVKTKILATIGPSSDSEENLLSLVDEGVNAFRLNFSHGDKEYFTKLFKRIYNVCEKKKLPITIVQDLQGPKIRVGKLEKDFITLIGGGIIEITTEEIMGNEKIISTSYKSLVIDAKIGESILIDDGLIRLEVIELKEKSLICKIIVGGILKPKKGMNFPGMTLSEPSVTERDKENMEFAFKERVDYVALSFVRHQNDIIELKKWMKDKGYDKPIIAKIEKPEAVDNFEEILKVADGIMIARGDLGVELAPQLVPIIQKNIIQRCNSVGKLVITATQMLESMMNNPIPTRAEASDVANAVLDGTEVVMLSGETAAGKYPLTTIKTMKSILSCTEPQIQFQTKVKYEIPSNQVDNIFDATGKSFAEIANQVNVAAIVVFTHFGRKARTMAKFRPMAPIFAFSDSFETLNILNLYRGITPFYLEDLYDKEKYLEAAKNHLKKNNYCKEGDLILFTAGAPITDNTRTNWIQISYA
ncbi:MAG: pyruvate kinase [Ignavibacteriae bacterium]|nr:pyruvate kinase [Ignavibacteriota bacterium]